MGLISVGQLAGRLDDPDLVICDVRWYLSDPGQGRREFQAAHLPRSVFIDLETVLAGSGGPGRHPLPTPRQFAESVGRLGISPQHTVVVYDSAGGGTAARMWWMLRAIGHGSVLVLDGGFPAWVEAGLPVTADVYEYTPAEHYAPPAWPGLVDHQYILDRLGALQLLDARLRNRFLGVEEPIDPRAGHIPTAKSHPIGNNLSANGRFRSGSAISEGFRDVIHERPTVAYCGSGVNACQLIFSMELAGITGVLLYEGSWSDWSSHPHTPIATGDSS